METASPTAPAENEVRVEQDIRPSVKLRDSERKCLVTGDVRPKDDLIRFVAAPDSSVVPDLAQNLPGRGLWVTATRDAIQTAVDKNLFSRAAKTPLKPAADLADKTAVLLRKRCLNLLGLACGAGLSVQGQTQVEAAVKGEQLSLLLIADDAGRDADKMNSARHQDQLMTSRIFTRTELGAALGHTQMVFVGLRPSALTKNLRAHLKFLDAIASSPSSQSTATSGNG